MKILLNKLFMLTETDVGVCILYHCKIASYLSNRYRNQMVLLECVGMIFVPVSADLLGFNTQMYQQIESLTVADHPVGHMILLYNHVDDKLYTQLYNVWSKT